MKTLQVLLLAVLLASLQVRANLVLDIMAYYGSPTYVDLLCIFGNFLWAFYSPWIAGQAMVTA